MAKLIKGMQLNSRQREQVTNTFIYRWTYENAQRTHVYRCTKCDIRTPYENPTSANGHTHPTIPLQHDAEWIADHAFYIKANGDLADNPNHAEPQYLAD